MKTTPVNGETFQGSDYILDTTPPMYVGDVLNKTDGVYFCIKNHESVFLWVNENFANLVGKKPEELIGKKDDQAAHVEHDKAVMASGKPLLNFYETIILPTADGGTEKLEIVTQKGLLRKKGGTEIIGITVCFSKRFPDADEADKIIKDLQMMPTGIGGYLAHGPESDILLKEAALPERFIGDRKAYSTNYYLLKAGDVLDLHSLNQDEQWFFHRGTAIKLHIFPEDGVYRSVVYGSDSAQGQILLGMAPHSTWFGAELLGPGYALASCSLAPAWAAQDSALPGEEELAVLKMRFPEQMEIIDRLSSREA